MVEFSFEPWDLPGSLLGRGKERKEKKFERPRAVTVRLEGPCPPSEVLALKHESMINGQWSDPVSGSMKSQASFPWDKHHTV